MEDDESIIERQDECACCYQAPPSAPAITRLTCGVLLSKTNFDVSLRDDIPDEATDMYWLRLVRADNDTRSWETRNLCAGGDWYYRSAHARTGVFYYDQYDPEDACAMSVITGGSGTYIQQSRVDACDDPPDYTITAETTQSWTMHSDEYLADMTGMENGVPVSGVISGTVGETDGPTGSRAYALTFGTEPLSVIQTISNTWSEDVYFGAVSRQTGYAMPDDYRLEFDFSPAPEEVFFQLRTKLFFTPAGGVEEEIETIAVDWKTGDPPELLSWAYPDIGSFRLGPVLVRHGVSGAFTVFDLSP